MKCKTEPVAVISGGYRNNRGEDVAEPKAEDRAEEE